MMTRMKPLFVTLSVLVPVSLVAARPASATQILAFGQSSNSNTVTGTALGSATTISGTDIAVTITQIADGLATPFAAFLDFTMTNTGAATVNAGNVDQPFTGTFSINSLANNTGTNYLSGSFTDSVDGSLGGGSMTLSTADPPHTLILSSSVIPVLNLPDALAWSFTNLTPVLSVANGTIQGFSSSITGTVSASTIPEPASMFLLGSGLVGLAAVTRRRFGRSRLQAT